MIKICHMTSAHAAEDVRIFHKECVSLAKLGYEVYEVAQGESYEKNGVHIVGVGNIPSNRLKRMMDGAKKVYKKSVELDCDIYHLHDPELLPYGFELKRRGKKVIFDSHERYILQITNKAYLGKFASFVAKIYGMYEEWVLKRIDGVIFPCLINGINPFEGRCKNVAIIGNYPLLDEVYLETERNFAGNQAACYIGAIRNDRGIVQNVLACTEIGIKLLLAGKESSSDFKDELISIDKKKLVEFMGQLNRSEVVALLKESTVGLVTELNIGQNNKVDTLPTKAYEYMASGLPVIISKSIYADRMVEKYEFGICVDPENVGEIASAIQYLVNNPNEAKRMGENGRRAVKQIFNWSMEERKLIQLYHDIME